MILFWEKERGRREEKKRREDRIKSAMGIKSFCHDIPLNYRYLSSRRQLIERLTDSM